MKFYKIRKIGEPETYAGQGLKPAKTGKIWTSLKNARSAISVAVGNGKARFGEWEIVEFEARETKVISFTKDNNVKVAQ